MKQYTAIVVDDELNNRQYLISMLIKFCPEVNVLGEASSIQEAKRLINTTSPEVVFLDIEMPGGNGFKLLEDQVDFKVIFVTAYDAYALKAIKFSALDYLLKPIDKGELQAAVAKLENEDHAQEKSKLENLGSFLNHGVQRIALHLQEEIRLIEVDKIIRIQADNNYCIFHLEDERIVVSKHLGFYYDLLKDSGFLRTHQSHLINKRYIERYLKKDGGALVLSTGESVPVSRSQRENILKIFGEP